MRLLACVISLCLSVAITAGGAAADEPPPTISDAVLAVALNQHVDIRWGGGYAVMGVLASWDASHVVVVVDDGTRRIVELRRSDLAEVRLADPPRLAGPTLLPSTAEAEPPARERHFGLQGALGPGNLVLDLQIGHFYGFAATSIGYPIIFSTNQVAGTGNYFSFAVGAGPSFELSPHSRWRFDVFAMVTPTCSRRRPAHPQLLHASGDAAAGRLPRLPVLIVDHARSYFFLSRRLASRALISRSRPDSLGV